MNWILLVYRVPIEPSRHRVAVWRHLRRIGGVLVFAANAREAGR